MNIRTNVSLRFLNTFGIESIASHFVEIHEIDDVRKLLRDEGFRSRPHIILGGGSNVVLAEKINATVIHNCLHGIDVVEESEEACVVRFASGVVWHHAVQWSIERGLGGMENLALIPGTVGAAPIQNIGAYGTEAESVIVAVHAVDLRSSEAMTLAHADCAFGYRDSIFKRDLKDKVFITAVDMRLSKHPVINTSYADVQRELTSRGIHAPTVRDVFNAVVTIRQRKLPDVAVLGNAGSFFKNPTVSRSVFEHLRTLYPSIPGFDAGENKKIPAAWLIEQCGCKGMRRGDAGVYEGHALVLVNYAHATATDILTVAEEIRRCVLEKFSLMLDVEVGIIDPNHSIHGTR